eukprot:scaffold111731_cov13-Tisochrysis_lutea.AAC.1
MASIWRVMRAVSSLLLAMRVACKEKIRGGEEERKKGASDWRGADMIHCGMSHAGRGKTAAYSM